MPLSLYGFLRVDISKSPPRKLTILTLNEMRHFARFGTICTIFKDVKNTHGGLLLLVKLPAEACTQRNTPPCICLQGSSSSFLNHTNGTKSRKKSHFYHILDVLFKNQHHKFFDITLEDTLCRRFIMCMIYHFLCLICFIEN